MFDTPLSIALFVMGLLGSLSTIMCFIPQSIKTFITHDTSGLSKWFFIIATCSSLFWLSIGTLTIFNAIEQGSSWEAGLNSGLAPILTNVITIFLNSVTLIIKIKNVQKAKHLNISESDYCKTIKISDQKAKIANKL